MAVLEIRFQTIFSETSVKLRSQFMITRRKFGLSNLTSIAVDGAVEGAGIIYSSIKYSAALTVRGYFLLADSCNVCTFLSIFSKRERYLRNILQTSLPLYSYDLSMKYHVNLVKYINPYGKIVSDHIFNACIVMDILDLTNQGCTSNLIRRV